MMSSSLLAMNANKNNRLSYPVSAPTIDCRMKGIMHTLQRSIKEDHLTKEQEYQEVTTMRARVIGYIPLDRGSPSKKSRVSHLVDVTRATNDSERLKKLKYAAKVFSHFDWSKHDDDISTGAVSILCSILRSCSPFFIDKSKQVYWICKILTQLYRCNEDKAKVSFCVDGSTLIINLLEVIEINYRLGKKGDMKSLVAAQNLIDKLLSLACVPLVLIKRREELISSLVSNINGATGKLAMLMSMKCLSVLSEHKQNKQVLLSYPGLVKSVEVGSRHMAESVRDESARIICNLAWDTRNKARLASYNEQGWAEIITVSLKEPSSSTSKQYAIKALSHLASEAQNKVLIVNYENGTICKELARLINDAPTDRRLNIAAAELICSLTCRSTASKLVCCQPDFIMTLALLATGKNRIAIPSARIVKKISTYIHSGDDFHADILRALVTMSYGMHTEVLKLTVKAYAEQIESPQNRLKMISHKGILPALVMLTGDESFAVRDLAQFVMNELAADVAAVKGVGVNAVLSQVNIRSSSRSRVQPHCYSPTSVFGFDVDFDGRSISM